MSIFKKVIKSPIDMTVNIGKRAFTYTDQKMTESIIRSEARFRYYDQFRTDTLEKIHDNSKLKTKEKVSIKDVMKKRGMKWDYTTEIFYMYSEHKLENDFDKDIDRTTYEKQTYEEIEDSVRAERQ